MTTELEREILKVLDANNFGLSVYAKPGADGISRAEIMDSLPTSIGAAGELAAEEVARTVGLSREEQEAEMRAQVPGIKGMATGAAVATATTIPDIIGLGYGGVKALLAKEGEKGQAFLDGLSSISGTVGSEKAGKIYAEYVGDLDATDEEKAAMMDGYQAGEFGGIPGLAGAYQLVKKGVKAAPDIIEGAGDAAKARMAEGGTTLTSGVDPDPLIAAAGDAVAKFRAPTEKQPGVIAFHGSGADFDEFKLEKIGTGTKATQYGHGLYFSDYEDVATYFRGLSSPEIFEYKLNGNSVTDMYNKAQYSQDYEKAEVLEQVLLHDRPDEIAKRFTVEEGYSPETSEFARSINYDTLKGFDPDGNEVSLGRTYKTKLSVDVENMLDWQAPLKNQSEAIKEKVRSLVDEDLRETFDYNVDKGIVGGNAYLNYIGKSKKEASEKLAEAGLDGIKYKDIGGTLGYTLENAPTNYVVFKPEAIKILEKYGIVGPVAITGAAAPQQEGESDGRSA